jgi:type VI secretion system protein ImpK
MSASFAETITSQTMNLDLSKSMAGPRSISALCTDLFLIVIRMREAEDLGDPGALRKLITYYLDLFEKNCKSIGLPADSLEHAKYALVALIDETVLSVPGSCRDFWLDRPLQLDFFGHNIAGEEFFIRLEKLISQFDKKKDILEVFYLCLSLGFEGKYKIAAPQQRNDIIDDLGQRLRKMRIRVSAGISPHAYYELENDLTKKSRHPGHKPVPIWLTAASCAAVLIVGYVIMLAMLSSKVGALIQSIQPVAR